MSAAALQVLHHPLVSVGVVEQVGIKSVQQTSAVFLLVLAVTYQLLWLVDSMLSGASVTSHMWHGEMQVMPYCHVLAGC